MMLLTKYKADDCNSKYTKIKLLLYEPAHKGRHNTCARRNPGVNHVLNNIMTMASCTKKEVWIIESLWCEMNFFLKN